MIHSAEGRLFGHGAAACESDGGYGEECFHFVVLKIDLRSSQNQIPI
jgi:hypothetical protein